jgi:hypothetical protein
LFGREADEHAQPMSRGNVEQRARRHRVRDADAVDASQGHLFEIAIDQIQIRYSRC